MGSRTLWEGWTATQALKYLIHNIKTWMEAYFLIIWLPSGFTFPGEHSAVRTVGVCIRRGEKPKEKYRELLY
jgi:hypothetical protein